MKLKAITITERNITDVYGRLYKFFSKDCGFQEWHNFRGGLKKRISNKVEINHTKYPIVHEHNRVDEVGMNKSENTIFLRIDDAHGMCLGVGDRVAFLSNRIIIAQYDRYCLKSYVYTTFQIKHMNMLEHQRNERKRQYDEELYAEYLADDMDK